MPVLDSGGHGHEIVIELCRAVSHRTPLDGIAVQPERHGRVANNTKLRHFASQRYGRGAEASGEATA
jgi:hypothetical protein